MKDKSIRQRKKENLPKTWLPEACRFGDILGSNKIKYAIFGAGSLAAYQIITRPTIDIDFVVEDFQRAITLIGDQPYLTSKNLQEDKDGIPVADFHFNSGVSIQIWDRNLYSLPMNTLSWSRTSLRSILGYGNLWSISPEDIIVSKTGRFIQQKNQDEKEANNNILDILSTITILKRPDYRYIVQRLKEGARRESSTSSNLHSLDWFFAREIEVYQDKIRGFDVERVSRFVSNLVTIIKSREFEYYLLNYLRKVKSIRKFQLKFMINDDSLSSILQRWKFIRINNDKVTITSMDINGYLKILPTNMVSEYYKRLLYSGKTRFK